MPGSCSVLAAPALASGTEQRLLGVVIRLDGQIILAMVKDKVLDDEYDIEHDADVRKAQFQWISGNAAPVALKTGINDELDQRQYAPRDVKQDLLDTPAYGGFAVEIDNHLGNVLEKCTDELHIAHGVKL